MVIHKITLFVLSCPTVFTGYKAWENEEAHQKGIAQALSAKICMLANKAIRGGNSSGMIF